MKKIYYTFLITLITSINCVNAQFVTLISENFNGGFPSGWTRINNDGLTPQAVVSFVNDAWVAYDDVDSVGIGDSVMVATSYYSPAGTADDWMISPAITLENNGNFLSWQVKSQDPSYPDGYDVLISNTLPVIDSFYANPVLYAIDYESPTWADRSVSLDTFVNQTIYIAFRAKSNDQFLLLIDNIKIFADTLLSVNEKPISTHKISVYPNPSCDIVNINSSKQINRAMLMDMSGKNVQSSTPFADKFQISLAEINSGIYILYVIFNDGSQGQIKIIRS